MENGLSLFAQLTDKAFKTASSFFNAKARAKLVTRWQDYCANGTQRVYATGDIKAANKMYSAAVICGFRLAFQRAVVPQIPFKYSKNEGFTGKIFKGKRDALLALDADGIQKWESDMRHRFDNENESKKETAFVLASRLEAVIKKERQQDDMHTDTEVRKIVTELLKKYPAIKLVETAPVGDAQALVKDARDNNDTNAEKAAARAA